MHRFFTMILVCLLNAVTGDSFVYERIYLALPHWFKLLHVPPPRLYIYSLSPYTLDYSSSKMNTQTSIQRYERRVCNKKKKCNTLRLGTENEMFLFIRAVTTNKPSLHNNGGYWVGLQYTFFGSLV